MATAPSGLVRLLQFGGVLEESADLLVAIAAGRASAGVFVVGHRDPWRGPYSAASLLSTACRMPPFW